ncbi:MAG: sulfatase-like hydrolase/transferase [Vampirovibrionales bacterium]|nr:sulfatase-like hydrolase/transferase [Vampirovibrionales bacterium]
MRFSFNRDTWLDNLALVALSAFAITQPILGLLGDQPGFIAANRLDFTDIVLLASVLSLGIPLVLILLKSLSGVLGGERLQKALHSFFMVGLIALVVMPILLGFFKSWDLFLIPIALLAGFLLTQAYWKHSSFRSFLRFLSPAALIFPVVFLFFSKATPLLFARPTGYSNPHVSDAMLHQAHPPVIVLILDELPVNSLLDRSGQLDAARYPNFHEFANRATWYKNTYTVGGSTLWAVPSILSGQMPFSDPTPSKGHLSVNLFTLLSKTHQFQNVIEKHTSLCPQYLCEQKRKKPFKKLLSSLKDLYFVYSHIISPPALAASLPDVSNNWGDFAAQEGHQQGDNTQAHIRPVDPDQPPPESTTSHSHDGATVVAPPKNRFQDVLGLKSHRGFKKIVVNHKRMLFERFLNRMTPMKAGDKPPLYFMHILFPHVPYNYTPSGHYYETGYHKYFTKWEDDREIYYDYQRHLMQLGAADVWLGQFISRLKALDLYDQSIIMLVADHGASWKGIGHERRMLLPGNYEDILPVPLLIHAPGQRQGRIVDRPALTIDILPTLAQMARLPLPGPVQGKSLLSQDYRPPTSVRIVDNLGEKWYTFPLPSAQQRTASLQRKINWFGDGSTDRLYDSGPHHDFIKKPVSALRAPMASGLAFRLAAPEQFLQVDVSSGLVPSHLMGEIISTGAQKLPSDLLVAVNDSVWCSYPLIKPMGSGRLFACTLPEQSFKQGDNRIRVFSVNYAATQPVIQEIPLKDSPEASRR